MHESERTVLANRFAAKQNWSRAYSEWNRVKARAGNLPIVVPCLLGFCALPLANRVQVPVYEVTPVESPIKTFRHRAGLGRGRSHQRLQQDGADGVLVFNLLSSAELYTP
jgi:hypothetical protein